MDKIQRWSALLSRRLKRTIEVQKIEFLSGGCVNQAARMQTTQGVWFVKWNEQGATDLFVREAESLCALAEADTPLVIPQVIAAEETTSELGILVTTFLQPASPTTQQDERLGRGLAQLHRSQHTHYGFEHTSYCGATPQDNRWSSDWVHFFGQQRIKYLLNLIEQRRGLTAAERAQYDQLMERLPQLIAHQPAASLTHGDLWSGNFMYTTGGPALIDPACYYADRECDLALMQMFGGFSGTVWQAYQEAYPLPDGWQARQGLYQLYHYLNHYYLFGGAYGQQALRLAQRYL